METDSQMIGKMIDSYEITELIGRGGMGVVYRARDVKLDRDVALKIMDPLLAREETFLKRFWSEAKALAKLQNPYIVGIYALRETEFGICIVMEFVKGRTLGDIVKESGPLPIDQAIHLFKQLLMAFEHAHGAGIIHRDVKPGNILVTDKNIAKVTDFGLAKIYQPSAATLTSITGGTLFYASPEQLEGLGKVDQRGDIYSLGMTLYECLTGAVPFGNTESDFAIREKIVKGKIPAPRGMKPQIPTELNAIVMKAIAKDPGDRFQTAAEMREALEAFDVSLKRARAKPVKPPRKPLNPRWLAVPIGLLLIVAGVVLYPKLFPNEATITVRSIPVGAAVEINGGKIGETPVRNHALSPGQTVVKVSKAGYLPKDTVFIVSGGDELVLSVELQSSELQRNVEVAQVTTPVETPVVEQKPPKQPEKAQQKQTPQTQPKQVPQVPAPSRQKQAAAEKAKPPATVPVTVPGSVVVKANPPSASVWIDGTRVPSTPYQVAPGAHFVRVVSGRNTWEGRVTVESGGTSEIPVDFLKQVRVTVVAVDADGNPVRGARIFFDGAPIASPAPAEITMSFGVHTVTLQREGYEDPQPVVKCFEQNMVYPNPLTLVLKKK